MLKVFCVCCKKHIYNISYYPKDDDLIDANKFTPANKDIKQPKPGDSLLCPYCNTYFMKVDGINDKIVLTDKGLFPKDRPKNWWEDGYKYVTRKNSRWDDA